MREFYLTSLLLCGVFLSSLSLQAQENLTNSRRSSYYTFIYKIDNKQAQILHSNIGDLDNSVLTRLFDLYPSDSVFTKKLPLGHYVFLTTANNVLEYELKSVNNLNMTALTNSRDLILLFNDSTGLEISSAEVSVGSKKIPFDRKINAYRLKESNEQGVVVASYRGHSSYFDLKRRYNNGLVVRTGRKILRTFPINHIVSPVYYVKNSVRNIVMGYGVRPPGIYYRVRKLFTARDRSYKGYMVLNKPKFRMNDTVRMKAFITRRKGTPVNERLAVYLVPNYSTHNTSSKKLAIVSPYRKGAYKFDFKLSDSLTLKLDNHYSLEFRDKDDDLLMSQDFFYEDYELKQNTYSVRSDSKSGKPTILFLKGTDSNDMPLFDVTAEVIVKTKDVKKYYNDLVFVADTLWRYQVKLDPIGETKIIIPDSIMPDAAISYLADVIFTNAEKEQFDRSVSLSFDKKRFPADVEINKDTINIIKSDADFSGPVTLTRTDADDGEFSKVINLPYREKLNLFAASYQITLDRSHSNETKGISMEEISDEVQLLTSRTSDSLVISSSNPRQIPLRCFLFRNRRLIQSSESRSFSVKMKAGSSDHFSLSVEYVWAGKPESKEYAIGFDTRALDIKIKHPDVVYPGQKANFKITVNDAFGKPVANADLTSFAITKKFGQSIDAKVPVFPRRSKDRAVINSFQQEQRSARFSKTLEWTYWRKTLGLDSIMFYKFLYPDSGYFEFRTNAKKSQFAPFVVSHGNTEAVSVIYLDGNPVYYHGTASSEPYSFRADTGYHQVSLRLANRQIVISKVRINKGQKLILSLDLNNLPSNCSVLDMSYDFSYGERSMLSRYFIGFKDEDESLTSFIEQDSVYHLLSGGRNRGQNLAGPFYPGKATFTAKNEFSLPFTMEPFYTYEFQKGLIKMRELTTSNWLHVNNDHVVIPSFTDEVQNKQRIDAYWKKLDASKTFSFIQFPLFKTTSKKSGRLLLSGFARNKEHISFAAVYIVNLNNPVDYYVLSERDVAGRFDPGCYQAVVVYSDGQYLKADSLVIKPYGVNYCNLEQKKLHAADSFSHEVIKIISQWTGHVTINTDNRKSEMQQLQGLYYQGAAADYSFDRVIQGRVLDQDNTPIPGVNVVVKGTTAGTVTDVNGHYRLACPADAELMFCFIGFRCREEKVGSRQTMDVVMQADISQLSEVVVVGYAVQMRRNLTAAVSTFSNDYLAGRVAGVQVSKSSPGAAQMIRIRGVASVSDGQALIILDGRPVLFSEVDEKRITAVEFLKGPEAVAIYGSRGAAGVILISTKVGATKESLLQLKPGAPVIAMEEIPGNKLRRNFRDYAFWQPSLKTDKNGNAEFTASFPDDITGWNAVVLGMASHNRTGQTSSVIQSYKPLLAQISLPHFLIEGDTSEAIGKITNYGRDGIALERTIQINELNPRVAAMEVKNSAIDSVQLVASHLDSVSVYYGVHYKTYADGELRKIPVYRSGVKETTGEFVTLDHDTTLTIQFRKGQGKVELYAQADMLDVVTDEIDYLRHYQYECNEQMASRLWALVLETKVMQFKKLKFEQHTEIEKLIKKLLKNQGHDGSWSWWGAGAGNNWITMHVVNALQYAQKEGFDVAIQQQEIINFLERKLSEVSFTEKLDIIAFLLHSGEKISVKATVDTIMRSPSTTLYEKLKAQRLLQLSGSEPDWTWINSKKSETIKGNSYWGTDQTGLFDNAVLTTVLVYKMLEMKNPASRQLWRIRNYFMEKRERSWRNTYESACIIETILPGIIRDHAIESKPVLQLTGLTTKTVTEFPFKLSTDGDLPLTISKTGSAPVYFSAHQTKWNSSPLPYDKDFVVTSAFEDDAGRLVAGKPVRLTVTVQAKKDAEYIMIEIPIPAGCSYGQKNQRSANGEVHREYYQNKTNIYCQKLTKGSYTYVIDLLPRYSGKYTLNPALVECMYLPVFYGRNEIRKIEIAGKR